MGQLQNRLEANHDNRLGAHLRLRSAESALHSA